VEAVKKAIEAVGVIFVAENGEGPGVRLRKKRPVASGGINGCLPNLDLPRRR
jgi:hypothetical protein